MREPSGGWFPAIVRMEEDMTRAVSYILAFVEFPVPLSPAFARMDLSDFPALIGAFAFGPVSGIMIELVKNGLQLLSTSTGGVGELANFLIGASFVWAAGFIYRFHKTKKTAWVSCIAGSFIMGIAAAAANYFIRFLCLRYLCRLTR